VHQMPYLQPPQLQPLLKPNVLQLLWIVKVKYAVCYQACSEGRHETAHSGPNSEVHGAGAVGHALQRGRQLLRRLRLDLQARQRDSAQTFVNSKSKVDRHARIAAQMARRAL